MTFKLFQEILMIFINTFSVFLIIVVLSNSYNDRLYRWFVIMTILLMGWVDFSYLGYTENNTVLATLFLRINVSFVSLFIFSAYIFYIQQFLRIKKILLRSILFLVCIVFSIISVSTNTIIHSVEAKNWGNEVTTGVLYNFFSLFTSVFAIILMYFLIINYFKQSVIEKRKTKYFLIATFLLIFFNICLNIIFPMLLGPGSYEYFGDYSAIIFLGLTTFAVVKRDFLSTRIIFPAFLITIISVLLIIDILVLSNNTAEQVIKLVIFIFLTIISIILLRSIITGVEQKEELFELNKELLQSREEYISLAGEQKDIIDIMGHEIKTPLSAIIQEINLQKNISIPNQKDITNLILSKNDMQKILLQVFESLDTIDRAVDHASSLVNNMIETARIDKEKVVLNLARFDIVSLVRNIFDKITKFEESKDVSFVWRNNLGDEFYIQADKTRIQESIESLLVNALSYGKNLNNNKSIIKLTLLKDSSYIDISIEDNGIGIDQKNIPKLGEKFMRIDSKTANVSRPGGTGLGLFVVKNIMKYHKGNLIIKSEGLGKGSTFTLRIPLKTN